MWQLADGMLRTSRITQAEYDTFAVAKGGVGDAPGRPAPDATFLMAVGGIPALNTADGWPVPGDFWTRFDPELNETVLTLCTGPDINWTYRGAVAVDPGKGASSRVTGLLARVSGHRVAARAGQFAVVGGRLALAQALLDRGLTISDRVLTIAPALRDERVTLLDELWPNHRSVTFDASSSGQADTGTSLTVSHTIASQSNRYLLASVAMRSGQTVSSVAYNSVALTQRRREDTGVGAATEVWDLVAPSVGTANIVFTFSADTSAVGGGLSAYGVDQTTPRTTTTGSQGNSASTEPVLTVASAVGELVFTHTGFTDTATGALTIDATWTSLWSLENSSSGNDRGGGGAYIAGATSVTRTDNLTTPAGSWAMVGVAIKAAATSSLVFPNYPIPHLIGR